MEGDDYRSDFIHEIGTIFPKEERIKLVELGVFGYLTSVGALIQRESFRDGSVNLVQRIGDAFGIELYQQALMWHADSAYRVTGAVAASELAVNIIHKGLAEYQNPLLDLLFKFRRPLSLALGIMVTAGQDLGDAQRYGAITEVIDFAAGMTMLGLTQCLRSGWKRRTEL